MSKQLDSFIMDLSVDQPIAALASPPGGSLRGIVRISGKSVREILAGWFVPDDPDAWNSAKTARSHEGILSLNGDDNRPVDAPVGVHAFACPDSSLTGHHDRPIEVPVQVLFWPNRRSYTGQPLLELHLPGSPCLLEAVLGEVYRHGARPARPGEFTLRAFLAGKLDLLQAEAVLGVIDASNPKELQTALAQLAGGVSEYLIRLRRDLLELLADLEAGLDFVDEDIEFVTRSNVIERLTSAHEFVNNLLQQTQGRMQSRVRPKVVLAGLPNAGKSTLFNRLAGAETALVSPEQGTTRDFLSRRITWGDLSFDLVDTAGWEDMCVGVAAEAQVQRSAQLEQSNVLIWCSSADSNEQERALDNELFEKARSQSPDAIRLLTKIDLVTQETDELPVKARIDSARSLAELPNAIPISAVTNAGFSELQTLLRTRLGTDRGGSGQWLGITAARCRETLESIVASLERASQAAKVPGVGDELIAVDLRDALDHLGVILGVIYTDDILDRIFSKFCIGK